MVKCCVSVWTKEPIKGTAVVWPKYGSDDDWVCQVLNLYVNNKFPFSEEESEYAACWVQVINLVMSKTQNTEGKKEEGRSNKWDLLGNLAPPYNPQAAAVAAAARAASPKEETATVNNVSAGNRRYRRLVKDWAEGREVGVSPYGVLCLHNILDYVLQLVMRLQAFQNLDCS